MPDGEGDGARAGCCTYGGMYRLMPDTLPDVDRRLCGAARVEVEVAADSDERDEMDPAVLLEG